MRVQKIDGYPVVDATEAVEIEIKSLDISRGEAQQPAFCAIARAAKRGFEILEARVHLSRTYLRTRDGEWLRYLTPPNARTQIILFDKTGNFEPGTYHFSKPTTPKKEKRKRGAAAAASPAKTRRVAGHQRSDLRGWENRKR
jgi:hypothetical protein